MMLGSEIGEDASPGVEHQRITPCQVGPCQGSLLRLGVDRQRIVAMLFEDARGNLELGRWGVEAWLAVLAQQPSLPFLVLRHHCRTTHFATVGTHLLERETGALERISQALLVTLGVLVAVTEARARSDRM